MTALTRRRALFSGVAVGSALALPTAAIAATPADGELIALCDQLIDLERQHRSLYHTARIDDDDERGKAIKLILQHKKLSPIKLRIYRSACLRDCRPWLPLP